MLAGKDSCPWGGRGGPAVDGVWVGAAGSRVLLGSGRPPDRPLQVLSREIRPERHDRVSKAERVVIANLQITF